MKLKADPNFGKIIDRIQKRGLTQFDIERRTGIKQGTISILKRGMCKRASYAVGVALIGLLDELNNKKNGVEK